MSIANVEALSQLAGTSLAAYATLEFGNALRDSLIGATTGANFTSAQADAFVDRYTLLSQQPNVDLNGFSAAVFLDKATGEKVLAIRGTEFTGGLGQIVTDFVVADVLGIGATGFANVQAIELYRYWKALTTAGGEVVQYSDDDIVKLFMMTHAPALEAASIVLPSGTVATVAAWARNQSSFGALLTSLAQDRGVDSGVAGQPVIAAGEKVDVTGHSLGGHLALLFARMFPASTDQVVTLNAPTLFTHGESFLTTMGFAPVSGANITRLEAEGDGVHLIGNVDPGTAIAIAQETASGSPLDPFIANHSSVNGVDAMNLLAAMAKLDPHFADDAAGLSALVRAASPTASSTYENMLDALRRLLQGPGVASTPVASGASDANREVFYDNLQTLTTSSAYQTLTGKIRLDASGKDLAAKARNDFSALASLLTLSPVVMTATDAANQSLLSTVLQGTWGQTYADWQADKTLPLAERQAGKETFSDAWIADRATLLDWLNLRNTKNVSGVITGGVAGRTLTQSVNYQDLASATQILVGSADQLEQRVQVVFGGQGDDTVEGFGRNDHLYGGAGADTLSGQGGADRLEGNAGADRLDGGDGADTLLGGAGADTLDGGTGNDTLQGGQDTDTYTFSGAFGSDVIEDSDGSGVIKVAGTPLNGADANKTSPDATTWQSADKQTTYSLVQVDTTRQDLVITVTGVNNGTITLRNWSDGQLGIRLGSQAAPPQATTTLVGDILKATDPEGTSYQLGADGNYLANGSQSGAADVLNGGVQAETIFGLGGNDGISGGAGDDRQLHCGGHTAVLHIGNRQRRRIAAVLPLQGDHHCRRAVRAFVDNGGGVACAA